jgi:hypothetical protein
MVGRACRPETAFGEFVRGPGATKIRFVRVDVRCPEQKISRSEIRMYLNRSAFDGGSDRARFFGIRGSWMERESRLHALSKSSSHARHGGFFNPEFSGRLVPRKLISNLKRQNPEAGMVQVFPEVATEVEPSSGQGFVDIGCDWYALCIRLAECNQPTPDEQPIATRSVCSAFLRVKL